MNMLSKEAFLKLREDLLTHGGFSVKSFNHVGYEPFKSSIGYLVSIKAYEDKMKLEDFTYERVKDYLEAKYLDKAIEPLIFGAWKSEEGFIYLDINKFKIKFTHAVREAIKESQLAIYDLKNEKSIYIKDITAMEFLSHE